MNERLLRALIRLSTSRPRIVLLTWLVLLIAATPAVVNVSISTSTDSVLDRSDPAWAFYQASVDRFGGDEVLVVALESERPFDADLLRKLNVLSRRLGQIAGVRRVDSLSTVPLVRVDDQGVLDLSAALESGVPKSAEEASRLRALIKADRIAPRALISKDERVVALNVQLEGEPEGGIDRVVAKVGAVVEETGAWVSGVPVFRAEINRTAGIEIAKFVVMTVIVVGVVMFVIIRSFSAVLVALGVGGAGTWITMAGLGVTSTPLTLITVILPSLMLALGCAYSMHLAI